ncbi:4-hydroxy-tetrahydrodipicolinate reductase [Actinidia chinensis var. chinensis]|uniref:4-hydroxy-tetrahydrodipicolinate reductase n=1 Tax=Actinidia chinensis var. chinensis TaxID=1590841 RepID=A0A2R6QP19_ACTCC|nr:4-hydroxy-tetrahydrodipicolinate reductase [Actinidia chinensis var. chinensis]
MKTREGKEEAGELAMKIWDCGSPLYDSYELVSLDHVIDRHVTALPFLSGSQWVTNRVSQFSSVTPLIKEVGASRRAKRSSMVSFFREFVEKSLRKMRGKEERGEKPKKVVKSCYYANICKMIGSRRQ